MFLLDTNVISATSPRNRERFPELSAWIALADRRLFLSAITASEIYSGLAKLERINAVRQIKLMQDWWSLMEGIYRDRILPFDLACAAEAGRLLDFARAFDPGYEDIAIAATAKVHGLTLLTANVRHFEPLGVPVINPFVTLPEMPPRA